MASKTYECSYRIYSHILVSLSGSISSRLISPFGDLNELFDPLVLFDYLTPALNAPLTASFIDKYTEENLQSILKTVIEAQISAPTAFSKSLPKHLLKAQFPEIYIGKNYINCYNFCQ